MVVKETLHPFLHLPKKLFDYGLFFWNRLYLNQTVLLVSLERGRSKISELKSEESSCRAKLL